MISAILKLPRTKLPRAIFNQAGRAGPRRLLTISAVGLSVIALAAALILRGHHPPAVSFDARMQPADPLPGGLHSTPEQDALAHRANLDQAEAAANRGVSYTPPIAASVRTVTAAPGVEDAPPAVQVPPQPRFVGRPAPVYPPAPVIPPPPAVVATQTVTTAPSPRVIKVAQQQADDQQQQFDASVRDPFSQWDARPPRTDIVLPPTDTDANGPGKDGHPADIDTARRPANGPVQPVSQTAAETGHILIPAGRGVYAHPVLALSFDQASPAVFQADSGPIAGDRMIGSFARESNRLIVRINSVIHNGEQIGAEGLVIAPATMEASVASDVDQHYVSRSSCRRRRLSCRAWSGPSHDIEHGFGAEPVRRDRHVDPSQHRPATRRGGRLRGGQYRIDAQSGRAEGFDRLARRQCLGRRHVPHQRGHAWPSVRLGRV